LANSLLEKNFLMILTDDESLADSTSDAIW
jgi:hypothetical protein